MNVKRTAKKALQRCVNQDGPFNWGGQRIAEWIEAKGRDHPD